MRPPRLARAWLRRAVPNDASGESVLGDLDQEFIEEVARRGVIRASLRYWRQVLSIWWWSAWAHPDRSHHHPRGDVLSGLIGDFRYAVRLSLKTPMQTLAIIFTLALGIGVATIGFAFADTALIRGLPIADPVRTVIVYGIDAREPDRRSGVYLSDFLDLRERTRTVEHLSMFSVQRSTLRRPPSDPQRVSVARVTPDIFSVWGLPIQLGRAMTPADGARNVPKVALLSDRFWRTHFAGAATVIGQTVLLRTEPISIIGVVNETVEFANFAEVDLWVAEPPTQGEHRDMTSVTVTGRLSHGVAIDQAAAEFRTMAQAIEREHPDTNSGRSTLVLPANRAMGGPNLALIMTLLVGSALLVIVIASFNVAGVLVARAIARQREVAMRVALGARYTRLFRQLLAEGLLLAAGGAIGGIAVTEAGLRFIRSIEAEPIFQQFSVDWHEGIFVVTLALVSPLIFSLAPSLASRRLDVIATLNASGRVSGGHSGRLREVLVATQLALAVALVLIGGLVVRTIDAIIHAPNGFDPSNVLTFSVALDAHAETAVDRRRALRALRDEIARASIAAGAVSALPGVTFERPSVIQPDAIAPTEPMLAAAANIIRIDEGALRALNVPLLEGRWFTDRDLNDDAAVALITRTTAERYFGGTSVALGRRLAVPAEGARQFRIVGVTDDVRDTDETRGMPPRVWLPLSNPRSTIFVVRHGGETSQVVPAVRAAVRGVTSTVPIESLEPYEQSIARQAGGNRVAMGMLLSYSVIALLFAAIGLYGTVTLATNMRSSEFATRVAVGARRVDLVTLVAGHTTKLVAMGLGPGLLLGLIGATLIRRVLFGVSPFDIQNVLRVVVAMILIALVACIGPALRASRLDVISLLRR